MACPVFTCPICGCPLMCSGDEEDRSEVCPLGHYYFNHSYGSFEEVIDGYEFGWTWNSDNRRDARHVARLDAHLRWLQGEFV